MRAIVNSLEELELVVLLLNRTPVCHHTPDEQIGLPPRDPLILLIASKIADRIGFHLVLLPFQIHLSLSVDNLMFMKTMKVIYSTSYPLSMSFFSSVLPMLMGAQIK